MLTNASTVQRINRIRLRISPSLLPQKLLFTGELWKAANDLLQLHLEILSQGKDWYYVTISIRSHFLTLQMVLEKNISDRHKIIASQNGLGGNGP